MDTEEGARLIYWCVRNRHFDSALSAFACL